VSEEGSERQKREKIGAWNGLRRSQKGRERM